MELFLLWTVSIFFFFFGAINLHKVFLFSVYLKFSENILEHQNFHFKLISKQLLRDKLKENQFQVETLNGNP